MNDDLFDLLESELKSSLLRLKKRGSGLVANRYWRSLNASVAKAYSDSVSAAPSEHTSAQIVAAEVVDIHRKLLAQPSVLLVCSVLVEGGEDEVSLAHYIERSNVGGMRQERYGRLSIGLLRLILTMGQYLKTASYEEKTLVGSIYYEVFARLNGRGSGCDYLKLSAHSLALYRRLTEINWEGMEADEQFEGYMDRLAASLQQSWRLVEGV